MFKDLKQFKAYLAKINNFDELYIIQQAGRGFDQQQILNRLQSAISQDAKSVFEANEGLWKNIGIENDIDLNSIVNNKALNNYFDFSKIILITK
jgi:hypothetical protein